MKIRELKRRFPISGFAVGILIVAAIALALSLQNKNSELFRDHVQTTFYASTQTGREPEINFRDYFTEGDYDYSEFSCDLSECDIQTPGTYYLPVLYEGKETNCVVKLEVEDE